MKFLGMFIVNGVVLMVAEKIEWISKTPLGLIIREVKYVIPHYHKGILEIILCLSGNVTVSYCFEEFTLTAGEFILVDKDAHYLYDGKNAVCVSFYFDLSFFKEKYLYIDNLFFVCEGTKQSTVPFNTHNHKYLKAMLLSILIYLLENKDDISQIETKICNIVDNVIRLLLDKFDIMFWYNPGLDINNDAVEMYRKMMGYLSKHHTDKINLETISEKIGLSKVYISEFLSTVSLGFQRMLNYCRASHAAQMLIDTNIKILDISEHCGFSDPKYFYKAFRFWYSCTPNRFRKKYSYPKKPCNQEKILQLNDVSDCIEEIAMKHFVDWFIF